MDTTTTTTHVSLCAGYGGIDIGLKRAIPNLRTIAFSEIEAFAVANLVSKMEAGHLDVAPVWTNLKTFPWGKFHGCVDILSGGYPCQPFSAAGKRLGKDDPRHLWPWIADGIVSMRPRLCFFENVEGHISLGLEDVLRDLQGLGYRCTFGVFSAAEVGAPHQRKRLFILAHCQRSGLEGFGADAGQQTFAELGDRSVAVWPSRPGQPQFAWEPPRVVAYGNGGKPSEGRGNAGEVCSISEAQRQSEYGSALPRGKGQDRGGETVADAERGGSAECGQIRDGANGTEPVSDGEARGTGIVGNSASLQRDGGDHHAGVGEQSGPVPESRDAGRSASMGDASNPRLPQRRSDEVHESRAQQESQRSDGSSERQQTEPALGGNSHGSSDRMDDAELYVTCDNRTDELRLLGNGVVPATAERAYRVLTARLFSQ